MDDDEIRKWIAAGFEAGWMAAMEFVALNAEGPPGFAEWLRTTGEHPPKIEAFPLDKLGAKA